MGMTAVCSRKCGYSVPGGNHRGGSLGSCREWGAAVQAARARRAGGRYLCQAERRVVTLGQARGQLTGPVRIVYAGSRPRQPDPAAREITARAGGLPGERPVP